MPIKKLREFLDSHQIEYITISHSQAFSAQKVAATTHISGWEIAKTVIIKLNGELAMAVLPASTRIDLKLLREMTGSDRLEIASEEEFENLFPECETGAMPPFGNLYQMDVYVARSLTFDDQIAFNAGTHTELIRMSYSDFDRLVKPKVLEFSYY